MLNPKGKKQVDITILYGLPGSGKTYKAHHECDVQILYDALHEMGFTL